MKHLHYDNVTGIQQKWRLCIVFSFLVWKTIRVDTNFQEDFLVFDFSQVVINLRLKQNVRKYFLDMIDDQIALSL